jgi:hypothetical protein
MKTIGSRKCCGSGLLLVLLLLPLAIGCGGQAKGTVSGKVTYQGKPLSSGIVSFVSEAGAPHYADIESDGSYRMVNAPVGPVRIGVQSKPKQSASPSPRMPRSREDFVKVESDMKAKESILPDKYTDPNKSDLTYTVTKGKQQFDIDLK